MPKEQPTIIGTVRHNGVNYVAGQEEELEAANLDKATIQRLTDKGAISGFGVQAKVEEMETEVTESAPAKASATKAKSK
jgi:hypothetical protein